MSLTYHPYILSPPLGAGIGVRYSRSWLRQLEHAVHFTAPHAAADEDPRFSRDAGDAATVGATAGQNRRR